MNTSSILSSGNEKDVYANVLIHTDTNDVSACILRITLGVIFFPHGAQKLFGWFGGPGFEQTVGYFITQFGVLPVITLLVVLAESLGAIALILGLYSRVMAAGIGLVMLGAMFTAHIQNGFFMNWTGQQAGEGIEFHLLALGICIAILIKGSGKWSIDGYMLDHQH